MSARYQLRPTEPEDGARLNALYQRVTGVDRSLAAWSWEWREGPFGLAPSYVVVAREDGAIVGHHGVVPLPLVLGGRSLRGARTENSMVDPAHRGRFIYSAYEAKILAELIERFDVIFTTAGKGAPGEVRKRLGYREIGHWHTFSPGWPIGHVIGRATRSGARLASIAGLIESRGEAGVEIEPLTETRRLASLWAECRHDARIVADRTAALLDWRIARHPKTAYRMGIVHHHGRSDAGLVWRDEGRADGTRMIIVEDLFTVDPSPDAVRRALLAITALHRGTAARITVRTLDAGGPLADAGRALTPGWALKGGLGSPVFMRTRHAELAEEAWEMTGLITQGN